jgi:hypothetical protein
MAKFSFGEHLTQAEHIISAKLGATGAKMVDADVGFPVKLAADSQFDKCATGDNIEGFVNSISGFTVENHSFGGVQVGGFKAVTAYGAIAIGDYVVAETAGRVKKAPTMTADAMTHPKYLWRYVSGAVGVGATTEYKGVVMRVA